MSTPTNRTLAIYGNRQDLQQFADRIRDLMPGGSKLSPQQALALAQVAAIHGLDPFNGEVWYLIDNRGVSLGIQIGIKGLRKKAREQMNDKGNFWTTFREIANQDERKRLMIPDDSLAFECRLFDTSTIVTYSDTIKTLRGAEVPIADIMRIVGEQPYTSGIGVFKRGEQSRMLPVQCAMKRAEADALKRRFDVPFEVSDEELPAAPPSVVVEGAVVDTATGEIIGEQRVVAESPAPAQAEIISPNGSAPATSPVIPSERPWTAEVTRSKLLARAFELRLDAIATNGDLTAAMAALSNVTNGDDGKRKAILRYVLGVESAKSLTVGQCKSIKAWIAAKPNDAGEWIPSAHAIAEAERILEADAVARGQQRFPLTGDPVLDAFAG